MFEALINFLPRLIDSYEDEMFSLEMEWNVVLMRHCLSVTKFDVG